MYYNDELTHHGILGQKWGVRRYRNKDGTLTAAGKKRYEKGKRVDASSPDPDRWVKEDLERSKRVVDTASNFARELRNVERSTSPKPTKIKMDLSKMTDKEMRERINRELLERQYNDMFAPEKSPKISKGRAYARATLAAAESVLAIGSSSLAIALAIKELKS